MDLSLGAFGEASALARHVIEMPSATQQLRARAQCVAGLAMSHLGSAAEGKRLCSEGVTAAAALGDASSLADLQLAMAEVAIVHGETQEGLAWAQKALESFERSGRKECAWRAAVIAARGYRGVGDSARAREARTRASALSNEIRAIWGDPVFEPYRKRSDIASLQKELERSLS